MATVNHITDQYLSTNNVLVSSLSSTGVIYASGGNSNLWNSVYTNVQSNSASWEESAEIIPTVTNYLSTNNVLLSSIDVTDNIILDNQLYYVATEDGQFLGRTKIKENNLRTVNVGSRWVQRSLGMTDAISVAMTGDGRSQIAVASNTIHRISNDYGKTWANSTYVSVSDWRYVAMSIDGKYRTLVANNSRIHVSNDYGINFSLKGIAANWQYIAMSSDGKYQTATTLAGFASFVFTSNDFGNTWTQNIEIPVSGASAIAISSSGKQQTIVVNGSQIYTSNNFGITWTARDSIRSWSCVTMSSDGRYQYAAVSPLGGVYRSNDFGVTWSILNPTGFSWSSIATSSDGKFITAVSSGSSVVFVSSNHGDNWTPIISLPSNDNFSSVAMSSDGKYQTVVANSGNTTLLTSTADNEVEGDLNVIGSVNYAQPYARFSINGGTGLFAMNNSTEYIIPWNTEEEPFIDTIESFITAPSNMVIKRTGTYHVKVRFSCYDMFDASDFLRVRLRQSSTTITNAAAGSLNTTLGWRFMGGSLIGNGEAYVEGETILRITSASSTSPVYLAATVLGVGGSGNGNTTFYPYVDNAFGTQSYMEVRKIA